MAEIKGIGPVKTCVSYQQNFSIEAHGSEKNASKIYTESSISSSKEQNGQHGSLSHRQVRLPVPCLAVDTLLVSSGQQTSD